MLPTKAVIFQGWQENIDWNVGLCFSQTSICSHDTLSVVESVVTDLETNFWVRAENIRLWRRDKKQDAEYAIVPLHFKRFGLMETIYYSYCLFKKLLSCVNRADIWSCMTVYVMSEPGVGQN